MRIGLDVAKKIQHTINLSIIHKNTILKLPVLKLPVIVSHGQNHWLSHLMATKLTYLKKNISFCSCWLLSLILELCLNTFYVRLIVRLVLKNPK